MKNLLDWIAHQLGYYTATDVASCVRSAEEEAILAASKSLPNGEHHDSDEHPPEESDPIPSDYIRYFVSYNVRFENGGGSGFGCLEMGLEKPIRSQSDIRVIIQEIETMLRGRGFTNPRPVIINWKRFEPPLNDDGGRETVDSENQTAIVLRLVA